MAFGSTARPGWRGQCYTGRLPGYPPGRWGFGECFDDCLVFISIEWIPYLGFVYLSLGSRGVLFFWGAM